MARIAQVVAPGIPHHVIQQGNRQHGSGNGCAVLRISVSEFSGVCKRDMLPAMVSSARTV
jgi:hypothetical protein